ncbi:FadR/GntR family transcriptional regulator [Hydrogenophaga sp. BPS33]|uniref:FadR/GntR family transcriptional regulator n=1 Tax=Hydrogenophaga sp. BPS33 TaxID=2651974 RepID=UPI00131FDA72|nr:GntR family transcriptional regulator [Hydrogenophaga sp. BPS33]QHE84178.1 FadR family transcriptional regulator [Hydrogenophaga sp. BPS33]
MPIQSPVVFKPLRKRTFEEVSAQIREQISAGGLREGDKLPPERQLAESLGVSRNTVREALRSLEHAGLIELKPGAAGGAYIANGGVNAIKVAFGDMMSLGTLSAQDLMEARIVLGREVARMACLRYTESDMAAMEANFEQMSAAARAGDLKLRVHHSVDFHRILARAAGNPVLAIMTSVLVDITLNFVRVLGEMPNEFAIESRQRMLQYLRERDVDKVLQEYTDYMQKALRNYMRDVRLDAREFTQTR